MAPTAAKSEKQANWAAFCAAQTLDPGKQAALAAYLALLEKWQGRFNLISASTLDDAYTRHFLDCAQLKPYLTDRDTCLVDLGSGAGFPGLVLSILCEREVHLVDSDANKIEFLRQVILKTGANAHLHCCRIEHYDGPRPTTVVSRACAPLADLLAYTASVCGAAAHGLFLKGNQWRDELSRAAAAWHMDFECHPSLTDANSVIVEINEFSSR